jgi:hypothetical protein
MVTDFVKLSQESDSADVFDRRVLEVLARDVPFDAGVFFVTGLDECAGSLGLDRETANRAISGAEVYASELLPVKQAALARRGVAVDTEVCGFERVRKTHYYRDFAAKTDCRHSLLACVPWGGRVVAALMLGRGGSGFSARDVRWVEAMLPTLGVARAAHGLPAISTPLPRRPGFTERWRFGLSGELARVRLPGGTLTVRDRAGFREMVAYGADSELIWSRVGLKDPRESGWPYVELFHLAPALAKQRQRALFIGCGGAAAVHQFAAAYPAMRLDVVELEPNVVELCRAWFALDALPRLRVHIAEGADFIARAEASSWDVIVVDAFDATRLAPGFSRPAFFAALARVVRPGGAIACNVIGSLDGSGTLADVVSAAQQAFDTVRVVPVLALHERYAPGTQRNMVVIAKRAG